EAGCRCGRRRREWSWNRLCEENRDRLTPSGRRFERGLPAALRSILLDENRSAADECAHDLALHTGILKTGVARLGAQTAFCDLPWVIRVDQDEVGRSTTSKPSAGQAQDLGRPDGHGAQYGHEIDIARMDEAQRCTQQRLQANRAIRGFGKWLAFDLSVLRIMVRVDCVDRARTQTFDDRLPIVLGTQR